MLYKLGDFKIAGESKGESAGCRESGALTGAVGASYFRILEDCKFQCGKDPEMDLQDLRRNHADS